MLYGNASVSWISSFDPGPTDDSSISWRLNVRTKMLAGTDDAFADALRSLAFSKCYDPAAVAAR